MGVLNEQAGGGGGRSVTQRLVLFVVLPFLVLIVALGSTHSAAWALQQHVLIPDQAGACPTAGSPQQPPIPAVREGGVPVHSAAAVQHAPEPSHSAAPAADSSLGHSTHTQSSPAPHRSDQQKSAPGGLSHSQAGESDKGHGAEHAEGHGEHGGDHGPALPEISPIPGVTFVETMIKIMEHELYGRTLGWRPNDIIIGRFTDNINNYQLGVLEAMRFTTIRLKDSLTRMGDADTYDPDLELALNLFMNKSTSFWFPSAESSYGEAVDHLKKFLAKLESGQRSFYYRRDNLVALLSAYKDILGNVNKSLVFSPVSWFKVDDYFYYAKGVSHVIYEILRVVRVGYQTQLASTMYGLDMMDTVLHEFYRVEGIDPWIILDSDLGSIFANHRANINAPLSEATHLLGILSQL